VTGPAQTSPRAAVAVSRYIRAWNEQSPEIRIRRLEECWAPGGTYVDRTVEEPLVGVEALSSYVGSVQRRYPGQEIVMVGPVEEHHGRFMFRWGYRGPDERSTIEGIDFGELDDQGMIRSVTGFRQETQ
jgi:SnoaL-like domain